MPNILCSHKIYSPQKKRISKKILLLSTFMLDEFLMIRLAFLYNESIDLPKLSEQKNIAGRVPEAPRRDKTSQKTVIET